jgi:CRISPR system Cascade subunit CasC
MVKAVPTGKQTNSVAQNPPSLIMAVVRDKNLWSLANAYTSPVFGGKEDIMVASARQLVNHWDQLVQLYGAEGIRCAGLATIINLYQPPNGVTIFNQCNDLKTRVINEIALPQS